MSKLPEHRAWVEIDLDRVRHNLRVLQALSAPAQLAAVVKSEAYGHGLIEISRVAVSEGVWGLCVVYPEEGVTLRQTGFDCPILVLGPLLEHEMEAAIENRLQVAVYCLEQARQLSLACQKLDKTIKIHVKVDTGLSRLSEPSEKGVVFVRSIIEQRGLELEGVYSHLADAEGLDQSYTLKQFRRFKTCLEQLKAEGIEPPLRHISASAAAMLLKQTRLDLVRAGIAVYGLWPSNETRLLLLSRDQNLLDLANLPFDDKQGESVEIEELLRPALAFKTRILQTKTVAAGSKVGYGCTYETQRDTRIAVLPLGYAEGFDRHLSNCGEVLIRGRRARVLGRVCMNLTVVDVTDIEAAQAGDEVVLIGEQQGQTLSAAEVAAKIGTIHYELVTRIPASVPRLYFGS